MLWQIKHLSIIYLYLSFIKRNNIYHTTHTHTHTQLKNKSNNLTMFKLFSLLKNVYNENPLQCNTTLFPSIELKFISSKTRSVTYFFHKITFLFSWDYIFLWKRESDVELRETIAQNFSQITSLLSQAVLTLLFSILLDDLPTIKNFHRIIFTTTIFFSKQKIA